MATTPARLAGVGVFVVGGLLLFTVGLFMIGDRQMAFAKKFKIYTEFKKVTGLQPGAIVRVSGAKAGTIKQIDPPNTPGGKFRVQLEITEDLHQLVRLDSVASIETEGLVGGSYLGVSAGSDKSPGAPGDATIPSKEPFEIGDLMQQMSDTVVKVNEMIDEMRDDVQRAVVAIADTADDANAILNAVRPDLQALAKAASRITTDAARIADAIRNGEGTIGKLVNDDELYRRATSISKQVEEIATSARQVIAQARDTLQGFQSKDGPVQGVAADVKQTMEGARTAMVGFAENMEALKHNFLVRGFFKDRGFFNLEEISPEAYRKGALTKRGALRTVRVWLSSPVLFEPDAEHPEKERLTANGKARLDSAMGAFIDRLPGGVLMIEGYAQQGTKDEEYLLSRARGSIVRDYLIDRFHLNPQTTGVMPLGEESAGSPEGTPWSGVALAVFEEKPSGKRK
jgi:phospholipid/cholesterol/gamma-HCH transport system substrate-binding protein